MSTVNLQIPRQAATIRLLVEEKLREAISSGQFAPGQRLVERELCEMTGVGRTSIREALRQLEAEGLITTIPHRGPVVSTMTLEETRNLYAFRGLLEGYAGRCFAEIGSAEQVAALENAFKEFKAAAKRADRKALLEAKTKFYAVLLEGGGNPFVTQTLTALHNRISALRGTSMTKPGRLKESVAEIQEIVDAIKAGDGDRAGRACEQHINIASGVALEMIANSASE
jgi:DNA-binding GntR family transcriptional regulator